MKKTSGLFAHLRKNPYNPEKLNEKIIKYSEENRNPSVSSFWEDRNDFRAKSED